MITYLNPNIDDLPMKARGNLKLYLDHEIVQIVPRIGRTIMFKSEKMEHEVLPTEGYKRLALTTWFSHKYSKSPDIRSKKILDP
jgi:SM-20-related protein